MPPSSSRRPASLPPFAVRLLLAAILVAGFLLLKNTGDAPPDRDGPNTPGDTASRSQDDRRPIDVPIADEPGDRPATERSPSGKSETGVAEGGPDESLHGDAPPARRSPKFPTEERKAAPPEGRPHATEPPKTPPSAGENSGNAGDGEDAARFLVRQMTIRDSSNRVVFRGDVDLTPTLERIERGQRNEHRNDGSTFQNREGRLPKRPNGYYKEYVHPTPGVSGPGPQRVVLGNQGEIYYTADHYRTFRRLK